MEEGRPRQVLLREVGLGAQAGADLALAREARNVMTKTAPGS